MIEHKNKSDSTNSTTLLCYGLEDPLYWPKILPRIQSILNNISFSIIDKTPKKFAYGFFFWRLLDLLDFLLIPNIYVAYTYIANIILFTFAN